MVKNCLGCGAEVNERFARVCGNNDDEVYRCISCMDDSQESRTALIAAGATGKKNFKRGKRL